MHLCSRAAVKLGRDADDLGSAGEKCIVLQPPGVEAV